MTEDRRKFGELLNEAVKEIQRCRKLQKRDQARAELAAAVNSRLPGAEISVSDHHFAHDAHQAVNSRLPGADEISDYGIEYWEQGHIPVNFAIVSLLAEAALELEKKCHRLDRVWLCEFLSRAGHPDPYAVCEKLLPGAGGVTPPIPVSPAHDREPISPGEAYFMLILADAQIAYLGDAWQGLNTWRLQVKGSDQPANALIARPVKHGAVEKLGLYPALLGPRPTGAPQLSLEIQYQGSSGHPPLLTFDGNVYNAVGMPDPTTLYTGCYAVLGSLDLRHPVPGSAAWSQLSACPAPLSLNGQPVRDLSYIILRVVSVPARTRALGRGRDWDKQLNAAERLAGDYADKILPTPMTEDEAWQKCYALLQAARDLLGNDSDYLSSEAEAIYRVAATSCWTLIHQGRIRGGLEVLPKGMTTLNSDLGLAPDEDVIGGLYRYAEQVQEARAILERAGFVMNPRGLA